jgi:thiamine kinase-like enzyme
MNTPQEIFLIDYDYAAFNYIGYDIANLINESSIDYNVEDYPGFKIVKTYTFEEIENVAKEYPGFYQELPEEVLRFMCVANLYWAIWSIKRFELNVSEGFGIL